MSPADPSHAIVHLGLRAAGDLVGLGERATEAGLEPVLDTPLSEVLATVPAVTPVAVALRSLGSFVPPMTLGDLLRTPRLQRLALSGGRTSPEELLRYCRGFLEAAASGATPVLGRPFTREGVARWAAENGVEPWLEVRIRDPWQYRMSRSAGSLSVLEVALQLRSPNCERAWSILDDAAAAVRSARDDEALWRSRLLPPASPPLAELYERALGVRDRLRKLAPRRTLPDCRPKLRLREEPFGFLYDESVPEASAWRLLFPSHYEPVVIPLEGGGDELVPLCDCRRERPSTCAHALSAIEAVLLFLSRGEPPSLLESLGRALARPRWQRALDDFDRRCPSKPDRSDEGEVMSWRLTVDDGELAIHARLHRPTARGGLTRGSRIERHRLGELLDWPDPLDRRIARLLLSAGEARYASYGRDPEFLSDAYELLAQHPRVFFEADPSRPVDFRPARLLLRGVSGPKGVELFAELDGERLDGAGAGLLARGAERHGVVLWPRVERFECLKVPVPREAAAMLRALGAHSPGFPPEAAPVLLERLARLGPHVDLALPPEIRGEELAACADPFVRLRFLPEGGLRVQAWVRPLPGAGAQPSGEGPAELAIIEHGQRRFVARDLARERRLAAEALRRAGVGEGEATAVELTSIDEALDGVGRLEAASAHGLAIEWEQEPVRRLRPVQLSDVRLTVRDGKDWFGLDGGIRVDDETLELAALLEAVRKGSRYVAVGPRRFVQLRREVAERLAPLAELSHSGRSGLELSAGAAPALDGLAAELKSLEAAPSFTLLASRLRKAAEVPAGVPEGLRAGLRGYQAAGFRWLAGLSSWASGCVLADDMGLGKTLQALALLLHRANDGPALVVAPTSVCFNWFREAERFAPGLKLRPYQGPGRAAQLEGLGPGEVLVTSWALLGRDAGALGKIRWATAVLDEAHAVKNSATVRSQAARGLDAGFRLGLTGTPLENHLFELWSLFRVVFPGLLGSQDQFRARFALPIERDQDPGRREALARVLRPFLLRRAKLEVARELPARTEVVQRVTLSGPEWKRYERARLAAIAKLAGLVAGSERREGARFEVLAELTRLRQLACDVRLIDPEWTGPSSKLDRLLELVDQLRDGGHRALVFSQFTRHLGLVRTALEARGYQCLYLDGSTPAAERGGLVDRFQGGEGEVFLISLKAGGSGLNLTGADYVVHLDPWWNPAVEDQASDRAHRIGQTRPVTVYRLVSEGTIEESILALHAEKRSLVDGVLSGAGAAAGLSTAEMLELLKEGARPVDDD